MLQFDILWFLKFVGYVRKISKIWSLNENENTKLLNQIGAFVIRIMITINENIKENFLINANITENILIN